MPLVTKKCSQCGCEHKVRQSDLDRGWGKTCSKSCAAVLREKKKSKNRRKRYCRRKRKLQQSKLTYIPKKSLYDDYGWDVHKEYHEKC